jgi:ArsR family metal-binding transcriptional regulator
MLLEGYTKEIFRPECNPSFQSLHCIAHLEQDITETLPYLNAVLGGFEYFKDPPAVTFRIHGKLITVHPREIAVNALRDEEEAEIEPRYEGMPKPGILEILKFLPKTNCRECGQPTCMVFASLVAQGVEGGEDCPAMKEENREKLQAYMSQFQLDL